MAERESKKQVKATPGKEPTTWEPIDSLKEWDRNPKPHDDAGTSELARSIRRFGFGAPIVAWRSTRQIVAGHGRLKAAELLHREDPGALIALDAPGPGVVLVRWVEFASQNEANAYAIADNRHTERNPMDSDAVAELLREIGDLEGLGYDEVPPEPEPDEDPEPSPDPGEAYRVIVTCSSEAQQEALILELHGRGVFTNIRGAIE